MADELAAGNVDGVWVDLGDQAVPAIESFQDAGKPIPPLTGEDNMAYLRAWKKLGFEGFAPVYSAFQWRTALLTVANLFQGKEIPKDWVVPQAPIVKDQLDDVLKVNNQMPDVHSARFGGEDLPSFPGPWVKRTMP
jgi:ribose transport system substrate-binding protein